MQNPLSPDHVKVQHHLDELLNEIRKMFVGHPNADPVVGLVAGVLGALCQTLDVQKVQNTVRALANDPKFWQQQRDSKAGRILL